MITHTRELHLKIKIKNLREEALLIKVHEAKLRQKIDHCRRRGYDYQVQSLIALKRSIIEHRRRTIRQEARISLLAYACVRGMPYERLERKCAQEPNWKKLEEMATRFAHISYCDPLGYGENYNEWRSGYAQVQELNAREKERIQEWLKNAQDHYASIPKKEVA